jgi:hypothetical protein
MSKRPKNSVRSLATIVGEIHGTLRNDIASIIKRGELLQEAKDTTHAVVHDRPKIGRRRELPTRFAMSNSESGRRRERNKWDNSPSSNERGDCEPWI